MDPMGYVMHGSYIIHGWFEFGKHQYSPERSPVFGCFLHLAPCRKVAAPRSTLGAPKARFSFMGFMGFKLYLLMCPYGRGVHES